MIEQARHHWCDAVNAAKGLCMASAMANQTKCTHPCRPPDEDRHEPHSGA